MNYAKFQEWWQQNNPQFPVPSLEDWAAGNFLGGANEPDFNTFDFLDSVLLPFLQNQGLGDLFPQAGVGAQDDPSFRGNLLNALGGPLFSGDPFELPGRPTGLGAALNALLGEVGRQGGRAQEGEGIIRSLIDQLGGGPLSALNEQQIAGATDLIDPNRFEDLRAQEENVVRSTVAGQQNDALNRLRDLGINAQGAGGRDALLQSSNLANQRLQSGLLDVSRQDEQRRQQSLALSSDLSNSALGRLQSLSVGPQRDLAQVLGGTQNVALPALIDMLAQTSNLQIGEAINSGGSFFERGGLQALESAGQLGLLASVLGSTGGGGAAPLSAGAFAPEAPVFLA